MNHQNTVLQLVRLGIGHYADRITGVIDWKDIQALAERQGLLAIVLDGIERLPEGQRPPQIVLLNWIGEVLQGYEARYNDYRLKIGELAKFYTEHGFKMMLLKGYGLSMNYPKPSHRPCGDIDIWQFGQQKEADKELSLWLKDHGNPSRIDKGLHHHTVFTWGGFMVENHYDFVNIHYGHNNAELEEIFKALAKDDSNIVEIEGNTVYLPSANLHALFILRHCMHDFASAEMNLRQVLDWAFFVEKHTKEIDWGWLSGVLDQFKMKDFFNCINAICVDDLGFDASIFQSVQFSPIMKEKVLNDILDPQFSREEPKRFVPRMLYKYRRWKGNAWKQELCYDDSRFASFFTGVWNHLLKPSSL